MSPEKLSVEKLHPLTGHQGAVYALEHSEESNCFFSGGGDRYVTRWDIMNRQQPEAIIMAQSTVYSLCFIAQKNLLVIGELTGASHVIDLKSKNEIKNITLHKAGVFDIKYSPNNNFFLTTSGDGTFAAWDADTFQLIIQQKLCDAKVRSVDFNKEETLIAFACGDGTISLYDSKSLKEFQRLDAHELSTNCVKFHPDGKHLLSGGRDAHLRIWKSAENFQMLTEIPAHNYAIYKIVFSPDGNFFATASRDKTVKLWNADDASILLRLDKEKFSGHLNSVNTLLWTENNFLISGSDDRSIIVWRVGEKNF
ncbi:MAG TPA: WD40 repeat domain-containing protein [Bacteroidia bacterium]|nr:WD40 repeat domain-containing protein [Bacteroidia bacterium]